MSLTDTPFFTVVMATYGRGRHIEPSIRSVLQQTFTDFDLLVVGDCCDDETEAVVAAIASDRIRWINLPARCGSQSAPNNAGIAAARGQVIAYLGHDDVWEPDHLNSLAALYATRPELDFGIAGLIMHTPSGIPGSQVTGLFEQDSAKHEHFFPPSSVSHRVSVASRIGWWNMPGEISAPVDVDYFRRAANADLTFASTGRISVHKFNAAWRYLSYLDPSVEEQNAMLAQMHAPDHARRIEAIVADAKARGTFMATRYYNTDVFAPGQIARDYMTRKGLRAVEAAPLGRGGLIRQKPTNCALDWEDEPEEGIRWSKQNPAPRLLLPYAGQVLAMVSMSVFHADRAALGHLDLACNGASVRAQTRLVERHGAVWRARFNVLFRLKPDGPSVLQFRLDPAQAPSEGRRGIGIGDIHVVPATRWSGQGQGVRSAVADALNRRRLRRQRRELSRAGKETTDPA